MRVRVRVRVRARVRARVRVKVKVRVRVRVRVRLRLRLRVRVRSSFRPCSSARSPLRSEPIATPSTAARRAAPRGHGGRSA